MPSEKVFPSMWLIPYQTFLLKSMTNLCSMRPVDARVDEPTNGSPDSSKSIIGSHTHSYGFLYQSKNSRSINKIKDYPCAEQAKVQGKSGPRKVIDPPSLGRRIRATSRSSRRTAKAAHTNPELRQGRTRPKTLSAREALCLAYGSNPRSSNIKKGFWRAMLYLFSIHSTGPAICTG